MITAQVAEDQPWSRVFATPDGQRVLQLMDRMTLSADELATEIRGRISRMRAFWRTGAAKP